MEYQRELYDQLTKPSWAPSLRRSSYVWSFIYVLYTLVGILMHDKWGSYHYTIFALYFTGWGIHILWLILFQKRKPSVASTITIGVNLAVLIGIAVLLYLTKGASNGVAFSLLQVYILWLLFALALSFRLLQLNR